MPSRIQSQRLGGTYGENSITLVFTNKVEGEELVEGRPLSTTKDLDSLHKTPGKCNINIPSSGKLRVSNTAREHQAEQVLYWTNIF